MTRERVKELLPVFEAYAKGEVIQAYSEYYGKWIDLDEVHFNDDTEYRIKYNVDLLNNKGV